MPFPWAPIPTAIPAGSDRNLAIQQSSNQAINPPIQILADTRKVEPGTQVLAVDGHVVATYDQERVTAEHLEVHFSPDELRAFATGNVVLTDPDGTVRAQNLEFSWNPKNRYAKASNVSLQFAGTSLVARTAYLTPDVWTFTDFAFTTDRVRPPLYEIRGRTILIYPGRTARIDHPSLFFFGGHVFSWPVQRINLDPRTTGLRPPSFEYRSGTIGVNWVTGTLLDQHSTLEWHADAFHHSLPGMGIQLNRSFLPAAQSPGLIVPRPELYQRFEFGYLESVLIGGPESEPKFVSRPRNTVALLTDYNAAVSGRGADNETFSFPVGIDYELGGKVGSFGMFGDLRLDTIRRMRDPIKTRGEYETSIELPSLTFRPGLFTLSRIDAEAIEGDHSFGWGRLSTGLVYEPTPWLTLSAGAMAAVEGGTPDYDIDPLVYRNGYMLRSDYRLGPRRFSLMGRYDSRSGWFDKEVLFTQVMGALEAFIIYRKYPGDIRYGVNLRIDQISEVLKRRNFRRNNTAPGSGGASGSGQ